MTDTAPTSTDATGKSWLEQLQGLLEPYAEAALTYKAAKLNAKTKALLASQSGQSNVTDTSSNNTPPSDFAKYAPWIAGALVVVAIFVALKR